MQQSNLLSTKLVKKDKRDSESRRIDRYRCSACKLRIESLIRLQYFKEPGISEAVYKTALSNIKKTISDALKQETKEDSIQELIKTAVNSIRIHCEKYGVSQTTKDLRILGMQYA